MLRFDELSSPTAIKRHAQVCYLCKGYNSNLISRSSQPFARVALLSLLIRV